MLYDRSSFPKQLKMLIEKRGMSQKHIADALDTTEATISRYISGDRMPSIEMAVGLADLLSVSLNELYGVDTPSSPAPAPDITVLLSCYQKTSFADRSVIWALLDRYMTPEQRVLINSIQTEESSKAI